MPYTPPRDRAWPDITVVGADTDAGKTTFSLLFLAYLDGKWAYWKPVETGASDSRTVSELLPNVVVHPPVMRLQTPVAPPLAARLEGAIVPSADELITAFPMDGMHPVLTETFGSPFSPLNETELQIAFIRRLDQPTVLVSSSKLGAVGRTIQCILALEAEGARPAAVVLLGPIDPYAEETIKKHRPDLTVVSLTPPEEWTPAGIAESAKKQKRLLEFVLAKLSYSSCDRFRDDALIDHDRHAIWHPYTSLATADDPLPCDGARDEFLFLCDGRTIIDGISSWWTILHGHANGRLLQELRHASARLDHVLFAGVTHPSAIHLARQLLISTGLGVTGESTARVFYSDNGSTAVEVALKIAHQYWRNRGEPDRRHFVGFQHGYHGDTFGAMAVSRDPVFFGAFEPMLFSADILPLDPSALDEHLTKHANETAGVILEPLLQAAGGMRLHSPQTLADIFAVCQKHGVLFIADEVATGGGRTGTVWAHTQANIRPDLICVGKTLAGGILPLAATLAASHVVEVFESADPVKTLYHGHSFTAHPVACSLGLVHFDMLYREASTVLTPDFERNLRRIESAWKKWADELRSLPGVSDVRTIGTIIAAEVDAPGGYLSQVGAKMRGAALETGVLLRPLGNVLYALPPLCTSDESLQWIGEAMKRAIVASLGEA